MFSVLIGCQSEKIYLVKKVAYCIVGINFRKRNFGNLAFSQGEIPRVNSVPQTQFVAENDENAKIQFLITHKN